jgi:anti-sigma factor ChrR (cupin superfamily)
MIDHRRASRLLADLHGGQLTAERRAELSEHVAGCAECRGWSETYEFLSAALSGASEAEHPSSEQLAHLAVDATLLTGPERDQLADHLEACADCRRELELCRGALASARRPAPVTRLPLRLPSSLGARHWALAASLILALAVTFIAVRPDGSERVRVTTAPAAAVPPTEPTVIAAADPGVRQLAGDRLEGHQLIEAAHIINASALTIGNDSDITLRAGEMVVLGEGFSIGSSATLGVEIAVQSAAEPGSEKPS